MISFKEYLVQKNIAEEKFRAGEPALFQEWELLFSEIHPDSFTAQKKFLINDIRRRFILNSPLNVNP
ncbi:hypothetical protein [Persicitalea jodogahamensis]|uniref:hypothetical protein n=1 Tax=Persicitalea jodogahamensis TaxID=402147 RepID=UPI0027E562ED|nr:hypothetical protein [Persicitalea jodogahamensis]